MAGVLLTCSMESPLLDMMSSIMRWKRYTEAAGRGLAASASSSGCRSKSA